MTSAPELWMPGVTRKMSTRTLKMRGTGEKLFTHHTMECGYDWSAVRAADYLMTNKTETHFVFHPISGVLIQMLPMTSGAYTLVYNSQTNTPTNTHGSVHAQIEVVGYAENPWTSDLTPQARSVWNALMDFLRSWGIPDQWATNRRPPVYYKGAPGITQLMPMYGRSGHSFHAEWKDNNHGDPGAIADPWTLNQDTPEPKPDKPTTIRVQTALRDLGYDLGSWGIDGSWGKDTQNALDAYRGDFGIEKSLTYPSTEEITELESTVAKVDEILSNSKLMIEKLEGIAKSCDHIVSILDELALSVDGLAGNVSNLTQIVDGKITVLGDDHDQLMREIVKPREVGVTITGTLK